LILTVNGETLEIEDNSSISNLLKKLEITAPRVAVEHNLEIVPKTMYNDTTLTENDNVEIVSFVGGG
jgi:sulfur carrier protein